MSGHDLSLYPCDLPEKGKAIVYSFVLKSSGNVYYNVIRDGLSYDFTETEKFRYLRWRYIDLEEGE